MNQIIKNLYDLYINQEYYENEIVHDPEYIKISSELEKIEKSLECNYSSEYINHITSLYMDLCNLFRKYDFINGLSIGIILQRRLYDNNNDELINMCYKEINKHL